MTTQRVLIVVVIAFVLWVGIRWANSLWRPQSIGVYDGRLAPCPDRPNCASSQASDAQQRMAPLSLDSPADEALRRLESIVQSMPRSRIVTSRDGYLHAEFRSAALGFVDDVEFLIDEPSAVIHFRSAARLGYADFGVNRRRMEVIRKRWEAS